MGKVLCFCGFIFGLIKPRISDLAQITLLVCLHVDFWFDSLVEPGQKNNKKAAILSDNCFFFNVVPPELCFLYLI